MYRSVCAGATFDFATLVGSQQFLVSAKQVRVVDNFVACVMRALPFVQRSWLRPAWTPHMRSIARTAPDAGPLRWCLSLQEGKPVAEFAPVLYVVLHAAAAQPLAEDAEVQFH